MPIFEDFSGRNVGAYDRLETPETLGQLQALIRNVGDQRVHAVGSAWAFSAPAYCEDVIVDTSRLSSFPEHLQPAVRQPSDGSRLFVWVEAGIKVRNLNLALSGLPRLNRGRYADDGSGPSPSLRQGRTLAVPTLGGAGGQSLAGAISTGTHGGDVRRPPIGDFARAMLIVGSGGELRLMQPDPPVVDIGLLRSAMGGTAVRDASGTEAFNAAVCAVGRFGIVYAYLFEVHDETGVAVVEHRGATTWSELRRNINAMVAAAAGQDEFLQVVVDPVRRDNGDRRCYLTRHLTVRVPPGAPISMEIARAGDGFGLPDVAGLNSRSITLERLMTTGPSMVGQLFCLEGQTPGTIAAAAFLRGIGTWVTLAFFPIGALVAIPFFAGADALSRIGPGYKIGDAVAEILNLFTTWGAPQALETVNTLILEGGQRPTRNSDGSPWLVHGRRWEIADFFDYDNDCYRGDSIEIFFAVDDDLIAKIERVFGVFDNLRSRGIAIGSYISLRFMSSTASLIGMAAFAPNTCSIEISMLRGLLGNTEALTQIQGVALENGGRVHWGQHNQLTGSQVAAMYGSGLRRWKSQLAALEGRSRTFSNPFTVRRDLEPDRPMAWSGWADTGIVATSSPSLVSAAWVGGPPLQVFVLDGTRTVNVQVRPGAGSAGPWRQIRPEARALEATLGVIRAPDARVEVFVRDSDDRLSHCYEEGLGSGRFSGWDVKGGPRIVGAPVPVAHSDGRLEVFAQQFDADPSAGGGRPMLHCYQRLLGAAWSALEPLVAGAVALRPPGACLRGGVGSPVLVVVSANEEGVVLWCSQTGGGWTGWNFLRPAAGDTFVARGEGSPIAVFVTGPGLAVHVFAVDGSGRVHEAVEQGVTAAISWGPWQRLPEPPPGQRMDPGARLAATQTRSLWLFGVTQSRTVLAIEFDPGVGWGNWVDLGGNVVGNVACGVLDDGRVEVFARRNGDDRLLARRQVSPGRWS